MLGVIAKFGEIVMGTQVGDELWYGLVCSGVCM